MDVFEIVVVDERPQKLVERDRLFLRDVFGADGIPTVEQRLFKFARLVDQAVQFPSEALWRDEKELSRGREFALPRPIKDLANGEY